MRQSRWLALLFSAAVLLVGLNRHLGAADEASASSSADGQGAPAEAGSEKKFLLRYKFKPGEVIRWHVEHRAEVRTTIGGTTQTAETWSDSIKAWRVLSIDAQGHVRFEHFVESVDMRQKLTGRQEVRYNSETDATPPPVFEQVARSIGRPLTIFTVDARGTILAREAQEGQSPGGPGQIMVPLPEEEVAVGHSWTFPYDVDVTLKDGQVKTIKTRQQFTLADVTDGLARIDIVTQVLTPIHDPAIEAQLVQRETSGSVRLDIESGRIVGQRMELDRNVVNYAGEGSTLRYITRFTEDLTVGPRSSQAAGPAPPPGLDSEAKAPAATASRRLNSVRR